METKYWVALGIIAVVLSLVVIGFSVHKQENINLSNSESNKQSLNLLQGKEDIKPANNPDSVFASQRILTLNITATEGSFEKYLDVHFERINDTQFIVYYKLNDSLLSDVKNAKSSEDLNTLKSEYFANSISSVSDLNKSVNALNDYPIHSLTSNIKATGKVDLEKEGSFVIDLLNYDKEDISKSIGEEVKVGFNSLNIAIVESTNDVGQYSSIALDSNGFVHISEYDTTNSKLRYCNNTNGSWSCLNIFVPSLSGASTSIAIDSNDKVHISAYYSTSGDLYYFNNTGGTWTSKSVDTSDNVGQYSSIAIDSNDKVHISEYDNTNFNLRYCNNTASNGSWSCATIDNQNGANGQYSSIAIDSNNKVHISEYATDGPTHYLRYCNNTASNGSWSCATIDSGNVGQYSSIAIDSNDKVHISEYDDSNKDLRYCNNTASNGNWSCATIDSGGSVGLYSSIAIDSNDKVHISAYLNTTPTQLRYCNNSAGTWNCINITSVSSDYLGYPNGRALTTKLGRIVDSTTFSTAVHGSYYNNSDLVYWNYTIAEGEAPNTTYPTFSNYYDNNASLTNNGTGLFNVTLENTNGTVFLNINGQSILATNLTANVYNASYYFSSSGTYLYNWTSYGNGTSHNLNTSNIRSYTVNASVEADTSYPLFSNNLTSPVNNVQYDKNKNYQFNITILNTNGTTGIEFNGTNYSLTNVSSSFYKTLSDLGVGTYNYKFWSYGNGSSHLFNSSATYSYSVIKNTTWGLSLTATTPITYGTTTDFTGSGCPNQLTCSLNLSNAIYSAGTISANYSTSGNSNYSANSTIRTITINKFTTILGISGTTPITVGTNTSVAGSDCPSQLTCSLSPANGNFSIGTYTFNYSTTGNENYTAYSITKDIVVQNASSSEGTTSQVLDPASKSIMQVVMIMCALVVMLFSVGIFYYYIKNEDFDFEAVIKGSVILLIVIVLMTALMSNIGSVIVING